MNLYTHKLSFDFAPRSGYQRRQAGTPGTVCITSPKFCTQIARERPTVDEKLRLIERDVVAAVACTVALIGIMRC
jgi:hypothetical protein